MTIEERVDTFVAELTNLFQDYTRINLTNLDPNDRWAERAGGAKFLRIARVGHDELSAYCFVALVNGRNKKLGEYKAGDVFKPDGWKGPAKHRRATLMENGYMKACGPHGVAYL